MSTRRNVVLVTVDSLRTDRTGLAGGDGSLTPTLDALAFTDAIAPGPATGASVPETVTGEFPLRDDVEYSTGMSWDEQVRHHLAAHETVAERFSRMGYRTGAFSTNPWVSKHYGYDAGFDDFEDFLGSGDGDGDGATPDLRGESVSERVGGHLRD